MYAFTGHRICFVPGHLKYNIVRLQARRLTPAAPCKRILAGELSRIGDFKPVNTYKRITVTPAKAVVYE